MFDERAHLGGVEPVDVWLSTDQGRLRAASQSLDKLDSELADVGFLRVHRRYVVNLSRIREIERGLKGELSLVMDDRRRLAIPDRTRPAAFVLARSVVGPHGIGNCWFSVGTSGHDRYEETAGHHIFPTMTSGSAARRRVRIPPHLLFRSTG